MINRLGSPEQLWKEFTKVLSACERIAERSSSRLFGTAIRSLSTNVTAEAFLQPVPSNPSVACLFLNRPQSKNAISMRMLEELHECLDTVKFDKSVRALIIRSTTAGSFCAGADLIERRTMTLTQVDKFLIDVRSALSELESLPMPTIAAIDGPALGGGLELSFACDLRIAAHDVTKIGLPEVGLGIIPGAGGTQRAVRLLGLSKAKDLVFTARMLTAAEALDWGVVDYVSTPPSSAYDRALQLAQVIAKNAPLALRAAKQVLSRAGDLSLESGLDFERASYNLLLTTKDRIEALEAFKAKRSPVFRGE
ncbi:ClpP/crotonase-like domain-containing protein [Boletus reticuloceps]|uniref:ClpP/crotonase-like domain-containing protein n=1 Tax=Boletus reticuloceps TaxID=495285 RepID=A0A8I2YYD5_9AGAM|nr:ClpP/crotonase-like domain-containing protein [Boletus reticuloceps]